LGRFVTERQRQARFSGTAECGGDAGYDNRLNAGFAKMFKLFASPPENERVAAFKSHDSFAGSRRLDETAVDLVLAGARPALPLTDEHAFGIAPRAVENIQRYEFVM